MKLRGCAWYGLVALALAALPFLGCSGNQAPRTAAAEAWATWGTALQISSMVYEETMVAVGRASAAGAITPEQKAKLRDAGKAVELSLEAARAALAAYGRAMAAGEAAPSPSELVLAAHREILGLLALASKYGLDLTSGGVS